jgi:CTP synthase (UTP-ammonia lyase)
LNPDYRYVLLREPLRLSGIGPDGEARIVELHNHPFYMVTLFVPQLTSSEQQPHPLIMEFVKAASGRR